MLERSVPLQLRYLRPAGIEPRGHVAGDAHEPADRSLRRPGADSDAHPVLDEDGAAALSGSRRDAGIPRRGTAQTAAAAADGHADADGTAADAAKAAQSSYILYEQDADGLYTFRIPFEKFDTVMELAAYGTKGKAWHDHNIVFYTGVPAAPKASFAATSGTVTLKWNKSAEDGIFGYEAEFALSEDFAGKEQVTVQGAAKTSQKFYLEKGNTYYLRVRSIKNVNDSKVYSPWSNTVICKTTALSKAKLTSAKAAKKAASLKWVKKTCINGYEIQYSTSSKFTASKTKTVKAAKSVVSKKVTGLKSGSKCYFRIRTYKTAADGKIYSAWSAVKSVKVK